MLVHVGPFQVYALTKERDMLRRDQQRRSDTSGLLKEKDEIIKQVMAEGKPGGYCLLRSLFLRGWWRGRRSWHKV